MFGGGDLFKVIGVFFRWFLYTIYALVSNNTHKSFGYFWRGPNYNEKDENFDKYETVNVIVGILFVVLLVFFIKLIYKNS